MNKYFLKSYLEAAAGKNWFPRPAKMAFPKLDHGIPPIVIKSVNIPKRKFQAMELANPKGKRHSKRLRLHSFMTPVNSPAGSLLFEDNSALCSDNGPPSTVAPKSPSPLTQQQSACPQSSRTLPREQSTFTDPAWQKSREAGQSESNLHTHTTSSVSPSSQGFQMKEKVVTASAVTSENITTHPQPSILSTIRYSKLGQNGKLFKQWILGNQA